MRPGRRGRRGPGFALFLLAGQMAQVGFNNIPPVTLISIAGQVVAFLKLLNIRWPSTGEVCISSVNVWYKQEFERLFLSAFFHADEWHLYFNMVSLLWKGLKLEPRVGSGYFLYMIVVFTTLTNALYVGLGLAAEHFLHDPSYLSSCAVGFSGVLFALKVITTHISPATTQRIMGFIPVPSRYACWAELLLIHILVPRASFIGHLSGILVGLLYIKGPLKPMMDSLIAPSPMNHTYSTGHGFSFNPSSWGRSRRRDWGSNDHRPSSSGYHTEAPPREHSTREYSEGGSHRDTDPYSQGGSHRDTDPYTGGMGEDEQLQHAMRESLRHDTSSTYSQNTPRAEPTAPPMDDIPPPPYPGHSPPPPH